MKILHFACGLAAGCLIAAVTLILASDPAMAADGPYTLDQVARGKTLYGEHCQDRKSVV